MQRGHVCSCRRFDYRRRAKTAIGILAAGRRHAAVIVRGCPVILLASQGVANDSIAQQTGLSRATGLANRAAFAKHGAASICAPQKRNWSRRILTPELERRVLDTTLKTRPAGTTHWSACVLAAQLGISGMMVQRVWQRYDVKPHRVRWNGGSDSSRTE